jgi:hypothetical protein
MPTPEELEASDDEQLAKDIAMFEDKNDINNPTDPIADQ